MVTGRLSAAVTENTGDIVQAWTRAFHKAATELAEAHRVVGPIGLTDTDTVVRQSPAATASWSAAQRTIGVLDTVVAAWSALVTFATGTVPAKRYRLLHVADAPPDV